MFANTYIVEHKLTVYFNQFRSTLPDGWSTCSVEDLERGYRNGNGVCLTNVPDSSKLFGGPKCGNGIVEKGEECDCGTVEECDR